MPCSGVTTGRGGSPRVYPERNATTRPSPRAAPAPFACGPPAWIVRHVCRLQRCPVAHAALAIVVPRHSEIPRNFSLCSANRHRRCAAERFARETLNPPPGDLSLSLSLGFPIERGNSISRDNSGMTVGYSSFSEKPPRATRRDAEEADRSTVSRSVLLPSPSWHFDCDRLPLELQNVAGEH